MDISDPLITDNESQKGRHIEYKSPLWDGDVATGMVKGW